LDSSLYAAYCIRPKTHETLTDPLQNIQSVLTIGVDER